MAESIPEKDQFLIAYPNYVLRETVTYPNGGVSRFYDDGVDMVIIDDEICSCRDGEQIFPYTLITDKQNHYMKIYRRVFRFLGFDPETIEKCLQKSRQEVLYSTKKISERGEHADSSPLELLFEQNFTDVYGMRALKYLQKEFRISDEDGNNYFLDYLVDTADSRVAIEENGIYYHHPQLIGIEGYRKQLRKQNTCALWGLKLYRFPRKIADSRIVSRMISGLTWEKIPADSVKRDCCWNVKQNCMSTRRSALHRYRNGGKKEFVHSSLYYLPQRENPGLWKKIFRNLQPEKSSSGH